MDRMPEVFNDFSYLREQLLQAGDVVMYCTPETAVWLVDADYEPRLTMGEAVKIEKKGDGYLAVPVKWHRSEDSSKWDWVEVDQAFVGTIKDIEQAG